VETVVKWQVVTGSIVINWYKLHLIFVFDIFCLLSSFSALMLLVGWQKWDCSM